MYLLIWNQSGNRAIPLAEADFELHHLCGASGFMQRLIGQYMT